MTVTDSFTRALGPGRGIETGSDAGRERVLHAFMTCGAPDAVRAMGEDRARLLGDGRFADMFAERFFAGVFNGEQARLRAFTKAVAVRPHWAFHFGVDGTTVHFYPAGHRFADSSDLMGLAAPGDDTVTLDVEVRASCGTVSEAMHPLNRGELANLRIKYQQSPLFEFCEHCLAEHADHPEARADDAVLPMPADALERTLTQWRERTWPPVRQALLSGEAETAGQDAVGRLDELVLGWAADRYARHTRANALRALRSNGSGMRTIALEAHLHVPRLLERSLTREDWLELLRGARDRQRASAKDTAARWARAVMHLSANRDDAARDELTTS